MTTIWILISLWATSPDSVQTQYVQKFQIKSACEEAAAALGKAASVSEYGQVKIFDCVPYKGGK